MAKLCRIPLYLLFLAAVVLMTVPVALCQEPGLEEESIKVLSGKIISVDTVNLNLEIKPVMADASTSKNVVLSIDNTTIIMKADATIITISDLKAADNIDVTYVVTKQASKIAKSIVVKKN